MLAEFLKELVDLSNQTQRVKFHKLEGMPADVLCQENPDGTITWGSLEPEPANHKVLSLGAMVDVAVRAQAQNADDTPVSLWYSRSKVTAVLDPVGRRDVAVLDLSLSRPVLQLDNWESTEQSLGQERLVWLLRTTFKDSYEPKALLGMVESVNFSVNSGNASVIQHGKRSVGKSVESKIENREQLPEYVVFQIPIWANGPTQIMESVECAFEIDPSRSESFRIMPIPNEIENAIQRAELKISSQLVELVEMEVANADLPEGKRGIPVLYGNP